MAFKGTPLQTSGLIPRVRQTVLVGGPAGNHGLDGIEPGFDRLLSVTLVRLILGAGTPNTVSWTVSDLTSQFSIVAPGLIGNAGGTGAAGGFLIVLWYDSDFGLTREPFVVPPPIE